MRGMITAGAHASAGLAGVKVAAPGGERPLRSARNVTNSSSAARGVNGGRMPSPRTGRLLAQSAHGGQGPDRRFGLALHPVARAFLSPGPGAMARAATCLACLSLAG